MIYIRFKNIDYKNNIKLSSIIIMFSKYSTVIIQIIINAILSRLIDPSVFGLIAIITVFVNFFNILSDMGISSAIIQNKKLTTKDIENIFSFTFYLGFILGFLFILFSFFLAFFYNNNVYIKISFILFFSIFFNTINMVPNAIILKNKNFIEMGIRTIIISLVVGVITIILTLIGMNYYALILNSLLFSILIFIWNYSKVKIKFNFKVNFMSLDKIKKHSSFQFAFQVVNYFSRNMDNLLIGKFMSNNQLAYYDISYKLMLYPIGMVTNVITPVMHPILSDYQNNEKIYNSYIKIIKFLSLIGTFISAFCFFSAKEIIIIMFGNNWVYAIPCFKILSFSIFAQLLTTTTGSIYQSLGKTKLLFKVGIINTIITVSFIIFGIIFLNLNIIAIFIALAYNINFIISFYILIKLGFKYSFKKFIKEIRNDLIILIILFLFCFIYVFNIENIIISLFIKFVYLFIIYLILLFISNKINIRRKNEL